MATKSLQDINNYRQNIDLSIHDFDMEHLLAIPHRHHGMAGFEACHPIKHQLFGFEVAPSNTAGVANVPVTADLGRVGWGWDI